MLQVLLDQYGAFKRASCKFALRVAVCVLGRGAFLFFHTYKHFSEEKALKFLP